MIEEEKLKKKYYEALVRKDANYDGIFFAAIKTTGVFCHATCPARKPKYENCLFFEDAQSALLSGFRPCKRCNPLSYPHDLSPLIKEIVSLVEENPQKRWKDEDFKVLGAHPATARRQFKQTYGMTFVQYARARRMGLALQSIRLGEKVIDAQLNAGYDSASGFYDAFSKIMGNPPIKKGQIQLLYAKWINTKLGPMLSISDETYLYLLEFVDRRGLEREIERLRNRLKATILPGETKISRQIEEELSLYFDNKLIHFQTPVFFLGSDFQKKVWNALQEIPSGEVSTYKKIASQIGTPDGVRAVGNANGANQLAVIIPCHRVIQTSGDIGGYGGGRERKKWLLDHEQNFHKEEEV